MQLPQVQDEAALGYWVQEMGRLKRRIEEEFAVELTDEKLRDAIRLVNDERRSLKEFQDVCKNIPAPISGMDMLTVLHTRGFSIDKSEAIEMVDRLTEELRESGIKAVFAVYAINAAYPAERGSRGNRLRLRW